MTNELISDCFICLFLVALRSSFFFLDLSITGPFIAAILVHVKYFEQFFFVRYGLQCYFQFINHLCIRLLCFLCFVLFAVLQLVSNAIFFHVNDIYHFSVHGVSHKFYTY